MRSFGLFLFTSLLTAAAAAPASAADYAVPSPVRHHAAREVVYIDRGPNPYCGPRCGPPVVVYVRHKSLGQAYPSSFDPRTRGEPHYYYGGVRTYVRYVHPACPDCVLTY